MTNYNGRLEDILDIFHNKMLALETITNPCDEPSDEIDYTFDEAKQAILRWVADEVIGEDEEETIEDKLGGEYRFNSNKRRRNIVRRNQRKILAQHGYKGDQR